MRLRFVILFLCFGTICRGQQDFQFTQFTKTRLNYNPAIAAAEDQFTIIGRHRNQWSGIDGAPQGQTLLAQFPTAMKSLGFGVAINRGTIGIQTKNDLTGMYAYRLQLRHASISLGLQASFRQFINDFSKDGLIAIDGFDPDPSLSRDRFSKNLFNLGLGAYLNSNRYYLGLSLPRALQSNIDVNNADNGSSEIRHIYGMLGLRFNLGATWKIEPHFLLKLAENSPYDLDMQTNFIYQDQVHLGFNIRSGGTQNSLFESLALLIGFQFTDDIFASMSYDFNTTTLRQFEEGSFEVLLSYTLQRDRSPQNIQNPRHF